MDNNNNLCTIPLENLIAFLKQVSTSEYIGICQQIKLCGRPLCENGLMWEDYIFSEFKFIDVKALARISYLTDLSAFAIYLKIRDILSQYKKLQSTSYNKSNVHRALLKDFLMSESDFYIWYLINNYYGTREELRFLVLEMNVKAIPSFVWSYL